MTVDSHHSDTDSDSSVLSEEVLPSHYPVKPRRSAGIQRDYSHAAFENMPVAVYSTEVRVSDITM
eukprot:gene4778-5236_t